MSIGLGWDTREGQGTEHGGKNAASCRPPRNTLASPEVIFTVTVATLEPDANDDHGREIPAQDEVMQPPERGRLNQDLASSNGGGAHPGPDLPTGDDDGIVPKHG